MGLAAWALVLVCCWGLYRFAAWLVTGV